MLTVFQVTFKDYFFKVQYWTLDLFDELFEGKVGMEIFARHVESIKKREAWKKLLRP